MPVDVNAVGRTAGPRSVTWESRDTLLYALGVGAGLDELQFCTENSTGIQQQVLPTFGVILCPDVGAVTLAGDIDWSRLVHGSQSVLISRPLPVAGTASVRSEIVSITDKGPGRNAVLVVRSTGSDPNTGELLVQTESSLVIRGGGGFDGEPGPAAERRPVPERAPDLEVRSPTRPDQALLYRLSGDRNPLHSDPVFATEKAGFPRPILHGLCTYGVVGRALLHGLCGGDPARFSSMSARFSAPVFPGDLLRTRAWVTGPGEAEFRTDAEPTADTAGAAQARTVMADGRLHFAPPG